MMRKECGLRQECLPIACQCPKRKTPREAGLFVTLGNRNCYLAFSSSSSTAISAKAFISSLF